VRKLNILIIFVLSFLLLAVIDAGAANRTALVIGNADYKLSPLKNPVNDATDMANALRQSGFNVTLITNANLRKIDEAIDSFGKKLFTGGVGLFYYAGHGVQVRGNNYLIPVHSNIQSEGDVKYRAVNAGLVLAKMEDAQNDLNIVILDACRNNPFARSFRSADKGLAKMDASKGTLIAYATAPGSIAADGKGKNGVYTKHLLTNIRKPGLTIERILKNVRVAVLSETSNKQVPWESSSLAGDFYFNLQQTGQNNIKQVVVKKQPVDNSSELLFWESIKGSTDVNMFGAYLEQFPNGIFSKLAEINIQKCRKKALSDALKKERKHLEREKRQLREQLEQGERQLEELLLKYTTRHPVVIELTKNLADLKKKVAKKQKLLQNNSVKQASISSGDN
jgi:hypothetical protein